MSNHIVLILGNGFDLDLGLKTSYKDFVESYLEDKQFDNYLYTHICCEYKDKKWIDIEEALKCLATGRLKINMYGREKYSDFLDDFRKLRLDLLKYIKDVNYGLIKKNSAAAQVLTHIVAYSNSYTIIDFNYTDFNKIAKAIGIHKHIPHKHIHGEASKESIIVGFDDDVKLLDDEYCQIIKSHSEYFRSVNINETLENADEVVFFGHSLGSTDYHYFSNFFLTQAKEINKENYRKKTIRIFTYDESARQSILLQLRNMNNNKTTLLYDLNDMQIYRTEYDQLAISEYCVNLRKRVESERQAMNDLAAMFGS